MSLQDAQKTQAEAATDLSENATQIDTLVPSESVIAKSSTTYTPSTALQNEPTHRIDPEKWFGLFRGYVRQDWKTVNVEDGVDELRAHWCELFFDLIYVACIVHLSSEAAYSIPDSTSHRRLADTAAYTTDHCAHQWKYAFILTGFGQFGILTNSWMSTVVYTSHFVCNQWIDNALKLCYMLCILAMGIFIKDDESYEKAFLISYGWLQLVNILMFLKTLLIPRAKWHAIWAIVQSVVFLIIIVILTSTLHGLCALQYFVIYVSFFFAELISQLMSWKFSAKCKPEIAIPVNVPHISERMGLFIMLILGESLISMITTDVGALDGFARKFKSTDQLAVAFIQLTFVLSYCIARLYYDCQPPEEKIMRGHNNHALRISIVSARMYFYAHQIMFFGLLGLGIGIKITGKHLLDTQRRWIDVVLPGYSLVVIIISLNVIRIAHGSDVSPKVWIVRVIILIVMIIMPMFAKTMNNGVIFCVFLLCIIVQLVADFEGREKVKHEKRELKEKRMSAVQEIKQIDKMDKDLRAKFLKRVASGVGKL